MARTRPATVCELGEHDRDAVLGLAEADPFVNATVLARVDVAASLAPREIGGTLVGVREAGGELSGAVLHGGLLQPVGGGPDEWTALGRWVAGRRRNCSSIVGRADAVTGLWAELEPHWGAARAIRAAQPLLVLPPATPLPSGHPELRLVRRPDLDEFVRASAVMFTEELGIAPRDRAYRDRVADLVRARRCLAIFGDDGRVDFKADIGAVTAQTCQLQGVWVRPELRGHGVGTQAIAGVLAHARTLAPTVSLYVNDYNHAARRVYARLGLEEVATLSTVLF